MRALLAAALILLAAAAQAEGGALRLGLVKFGTAAWEIDTLRRHGLDRGLGVDLVPVDLADPAAGEVALQAGGVDAIVTDWLWVSRQRHAGQRIVFVPRSTALGEILVRPGSPIRTMADLEGKRLGVAGGPLDKSWLLLRAYSRRTLGRDIADRVEAVYGAPPLLSEELVKGRVDAVLTFWPFAARLEVGGCRAILSLTGIMAGLGFSPPVPMIGYAFSERWISGHPEAARRFLDALAAADRRMESDEEWQALKPLTRAGDDATLAALRRRFMAGLLPADQESGAEAASGRLYAVLAGIGGTALTGGASDLAPGTFWRGAGK